MTDSRLAEAPSTFRSTIAGRPALVLALATLTAALTGPGQTIGVSVFIDSFVSDLNLSRSEVSGAYLFGTLAGSLVLPRVGSLIDRHGVRRAQIVVGVLFSLALVNMSFVGSLISLTIGFWGIRLLGQGSLSLVSVLTVSLSFKQFRGTALGLFSTGSGALMVLAPLVLSLAINRLGWRHAWLAAAIVIAATVIPIAWLGFRHLPSDSSQPDTGELDGPGELEGPDVGSAAEGANLTDFTRGQAVRTRGFWIVAAVSGSAGMLVTAMNFHQIDMLTSAGLSSAAAAALFVPQIVGSTAAGLGFGWVADRVGTRLLPVAAMVLLVLAHILASTAQPGILVLIYAIVLGSVGGATRTVTSVLLPSWFGTTHLGSIQGTLTLLGVAASAIGPLALAMTQANLGSYPPALLALATIPALAALVALLWAPTS